MRVAEKIIAVKGMNDILPHETPTWQHVEDIMRKVLQSFGYQEMRFPIVEKTELFKRSIGDVTDIVEKEMYTFLDRNDESLSLRPEGTASCVRAGIEHGLLYNQQQRFFYSGPYFRYEKPQKGRYRQFHQYAAEAFGFEGPEIDAELIILSATILKKLGVLPYVNLQLNSLGTPDTRKQYRAKLIAYFEKHKNELDEDSLKRLHKNPMRILDSKNPALKSVIKNAPKLIDSLDEASRNHFETLQRYLRHGDIAFTINPCLVRGLDYYTKTVFEWTTEHLGAQGTVCAGGRYDGLVAQLGGKDTPALGFAFGMERTILLAQETKQVRLENEVHAYLMVDSDLHYPLALKIANHLREEMPDLHLILHCGGGSLKSQFKKADKSGALYGIILGDQEIKTNRVSVKALREDIPQQTLQQNDLAEYLRTKISKI